MRGLAKLLLHVYQVPRTVKGFLITMALNESKSDYASYVELLVNQSTN